MKEVVHCTFVTDDESVIFGNLTKTDRDYYDAVHDGYAVAATQLQKQMGKHVDPWCHGHIMQYEHQKSHTMYNFTATKGAETVNWEEALMRNNDDFNKCDWASLVQGFYVTKMGAGSTYFWCHKDFQAESESIATALFGRAAQQRGSFYHKMAKVWANTWWDANEYVNQHLHSEPCIDTSKKRHELVWKHHAQMALLQMSKLVSPFNDIMKRIGNPDDLLRHYSVRPGVRNATAAAFRTQYALVMTPPLILDSFPCFTDMYARAPHLALPPSHPKDFLRSWMATRYESLGHSVCTNSSTDLDTVADLKHIFGNYNVQNMCYFDHDNARAIFDDHHCLVHLYSPKQRVMANASYGYSSYASGGYETLAPYRLKPKHARHPYHCDIHAQKKPGYVDPELLLDMVEHDFLGVRNDNSLISYFAEEFFLLDDTSSAPVYCDPDFKELRNVNALSGLKKLPGHDDVLVRYMRLQTGPCAGWYLCVSEGRLWPQGCGIRPLNHQEVEALRQHPSAANDDWQSCLSQDTIYRLKGHGLLLSKHSSTEGRAHDFRMFDCINPDMNFELGHKAKHLLAQYVEPYMKKIGFPKPIDGRIQLIGAWWHRYGERESALLMMAPDDQVMQQQLTVLLHLLEEAMPRDLNLGVCSNSDHHVPLHAQHLIPTVDVRAIMVKKTTLAHYLRDRILPNMPSFKVRINLNAAFPIDHPVGMLVHMVRHAALFTEEGAHRSGRSTYTAVQLRSRTWAGHCFDQSRYDLSDVDAPEIPSIVADRSACNDNNDTFSLRKLFPDYRIDREAWERAITLADIGNTVTQLLDADSLEAHADRQKMLQNVSWDACMQSLQPLTKVLKNGGLQLSYNENFEVEAVDFVGEASPALTAKALREAVALVADRAKLKHRLVCSEYSSGFRLGKPSAISNAGNVDDTMAYHFVPPHNSTTHVLALINQTVSVETDNLSCRDRKFTEWNFDDYASDMREWIIQDDRLNADTNTVIGSLPFVALTELWALQECTVSNPNIKAQGDATNIHAHIVQDSIFTFSATIGSREVVTHVDIFSSDPLEFHAQAIILAMDADAVKRLLRYAEVKAIVGNVSVCDGVDAPIVIDLHQHDMTFSIYDRLFDMAAPKRDNLAWSKLLRQIYTQVGDAMFYSLFDAVIQPSGKQSCSLDDILGLSHRPVFHNGLEFIDIYIEDQQLRQALRLSCEGCGKPGGTMPSSCRYGCCRNCEFYDYEQQLTTDCARELAQLLRMETGCIKYRLGLGAFTPLEANFQANVSYLHRDTIPARVLAQAATVRLRPEYLHKINASFGTRRQTLNLTMVLNLTRNNHQDVPLLPLSPWLASAITYGLRLRSTTVIHCPSKAVNRSDALHLHVTPTNPHQLEQHKEDKWMKWSSQMMEARGPDWWFPLAAPCVQQAEPKLLQLHKANLALLHGTVAILTYNVNADYAYTRVKYALTLAINDQRLPECVLEHHRNADVPGLLPTELLRRWRQFVRKSVFEGNLKKHLDAVLPGGLSAAQAHMLLCLEHNTAKPDDKRCKEFIDCLLYCADLRRKDDLCVLRYQLTLNTLFQEPGRATPAVKKEACEVAALIMTRNCTLAHWAFANTRVHAHLAAMLRTEPTQFDVPDNCVSMLFHAVMTDLNYTNVPRSLTIGAVKRKRGVEQTTTVKSDLHKFLRLPVNISLLCPLMGINPTRSATAHVLNFHSAAKDARAAYVTANSTVDLTAPNRPVTRSQKRKLEQEDVQPNRSLPPQHSPPLQLTAQRAIAASWTP